MDLFDSNGAMFSECRKYRYALWRIWDESKPLVMFIGLNPSTANESANDKTIARVIGFATSWGYGGVYMMNLFTYVTKYPTELVKDDNKEENFKRILEIAGKCKLIMFAWGNFYVMGRDKELMALIPEGHCLKQNKNGSPQHPLFVPAETKPQKFVRK